MGNRITYKVEPQPNGQKFRIARANASGEIVDVVALPARRLRSKAIQRRKRTR